MFMRMVRGTLFRQKSKMLMIALTVALGASLATGLINVMLGVGDKINEELKAYGANINVVPKEASLLGELYGQQENTETSTAFLKEEDLPKLKTIFWAHNIVDFTPYLNTVVEAKTTDGKELTFKAIGTWFEREVHAPSGEVFMTGMKRLKSWWEVEGEWITDGEKEAIMMGQLLADKLSLKEGDSIELGGQKNNKKYKIAAIYNAGSAEDEAIYMSLGEAQYLSGHDGKLTRVEVSALTTPDNDLARKAAKNPLSLTIKEWETWYCTAYVSAICYQIQQVMEDSVAKPIRQVAESEGAILQKTQYLMLLITILSMMGSAMGIANLVTSSVMERSSEIGLLKAIGASNGRVVGIILTEIMLTGLIGGVGGYFAGLGFAQLIAHSVFGSGLVISGIAIPLVSIMVVIVILIGSLPAIRYLLSLDPAAVLHGR